MVTHACLTRARTELGRDIRVPDDVPRIVDLADLEGEGMFEFAEMDADDASDATLAQLVRIDADKSIAANWAIPPPLPDAPLYDLTGHFDTDEKHPGTRHQASSTTIIPCIRTDEEWALADGTVIETEPSTRPHVDIVRKVFKSSIPVSYPNPSWASALPCLVGGWNRTPLARAQLLDVSAGKCVIGDWTVRVDPEVGLVIGRDAT